MCEIWIRTHVAIAWKHAQKWLLQFRLASEKLLFRASELYLEWFTPDPLWNNELNLGAIVSVLYLTRNCKSTKLKGSQIKFLKNPAQLYRQIQWFFALFFVWRVHPARASKEYIQTSDIQDGCPVAWPVTLGELHDNDRLQGPWTRKNSIREWKH